MKKTVFIVIISIFVFTSAISAEPAQTAPNESSAEGYQQQKNKQEKWGDKRSRKEQREQRRDFIGKAIFPTFAEIKELSGEFSTNKNGFPIIKTENGEIKILIPKDVIYTLK